MAAACCDMSERVSPSSESGVAIKRMLPKSVSLHVFSQDVSEVINRVRAAFGNIPMRAVSDLPEIKAAEATVERAARLVLNGAEPFDVWQGALIVYESTWMSALRDLRRSGKWAA